MNVGLDCWPAAWPDPSLHMSWALRTNLQRKNATLMEDNHHLQLIAVPSPPPSAMRSAYLLTLCRYHLLCISKCHGAYFINWGGSAAVVAPPKCVFLGNGFLHDWVSYERSRRETAVILIVRTLRCFLDVPKRDSFLVSFVSYRKEERNGGARG